VRLVVVPAILFVVVSAAVFGFAKWHPAKPEAVPAPAASGPKDPVRGEELFAENCATCHGEGGQGGGVGPALPGSELTIAQAQSIITSGRGIMPGGLVEGQDLEDVLAYLQIVFAQ
jgi:mono/diheme cytochrome c family protein